jgi:hypothetical protein
MYDRTEMARTRIDDMLRNAEAYRLTKGTRAAHSAERRATMRRIAVAASSLVIWPFKH